MKQSSSRYQSALSGFTLIELMVVVAIIAIVSAISLPIYTTFTGRAKVTAAVEEGSRLTSNVQIQLSNGTDIHTASDVGGQSSTGNCSTLAVVGVASTGTGTITCSIANGPAAVNNQAVTWSLSAEHWTCATTAPNLYAPKSCPGS